MHAISDSLLSNRAAHSSGSRRSKAYVTLYLIVTISFHYPSTLTLTNMKCYLKPEGGTLVNGVRLAYDPKRTYLKSVSITTPYDQIITVVEAAQTYAFFLRARRLYVLEGLTFTISAYDPLTIFSQHTNYPFSLVPWLAVGSMTYSCSIPLIVRTYWASTYNIAPVEWNEVPYNPLSFSGLGVSSPALNSYDLSITDFLVPIAVGASVSIENIVGTNLLTFTNITGTSGQAAVLLLSFIPPRAAVGYVPAMQPRLAPVFTGSLSLYSISSIGNVYVRTNPNL